jgi:succinate-semialdehyde dehydrogenase/glutarate-semialdehyde dehydrogenase
VRSTLAELTGIDVPTRLLIGGEWTGGRGGDTMAVIDPSTEDALAEVANGTVEDALDAVGAAAGALAGWAATPPRQRAECLRRAFELMTARRWPRAARWCSSRPRRPRSPRWPSPGSSPRRGSPAAW